MAIFTPGRNVILHLKLNPLMMNGFTHLYHLGESILIFRGFRCGLKFLFHLSMKFLYANRIARDGMPQNLWGYIVCLCPIKRMPEKSTTDFFFFFFNSVLRPFQDYFSSYETGQTVGGAKTGEPREKPPGTPACRTWLVSRGQSGVRTHTRHSGEMIE